VIHFYPNTYNNYFLLHLILKAYLECTYKLRKKKCRPFLALIICSASYDARCEGSDFTLARLNPEAPPPVPAPKSALKPEHAELLLLGSDIRLEASGVPLSLCSVPTGIAPLRELSASVVCRFRF